MSQPLCLTTMEDPDSQSIGVTIVCLLAQSPFLHAGSDHGWSCLLARSPSHTFPQSTPRLGLDSLST